jgi:hypothetical protein
LSLLPGVYILSLMPAIIAEMPGLLLLFSLLSVLSLLSMIADVDAPRALAEET